VNKIVSSADLLPLKRVVLAPTRRLFLSVEALRQGDRAVIDRKPKRDVQPERSGRRIGINLEGSRFEARRSGI
jgi:hypothetical protein